MHAIRRLCLSAWLAALSAVAPVGACAQGFPSKPITVVVPFPPGGAADTSTRVIANKLAEFVKQPVVVDNRPGAGGQIAATAVKQAAADGYTLFLANIGSHGTNQALYSKLSYDPVKDFEPVTAMVSIPQLLVVPASSPVHSIANLVARAKASPGKLAYGSQSVGAGGHIAGEILKSKHGLEIVHVPYKGSAPALQDLVAGRLDFMFDAMPSSLPFVRDKRLRALAIDAPTRSPLLPDVPTLVEQGFKGYEASPWFGIAAPAGTPRPVVDKLHADLRKVLQSPDVVAKLAEAGIEVMASDPKAFAALIRSDTERLGRVIRESGARLD